MDKVGTIRRAEHEGGYSLWGYIQNWDEDLPQWRCVYSTPTTWDREIVGKVWPSNVRLISESTYIVGSLRSMGIEVESE